MLFESSMLAQASSCYSIHLPCQTQGSIFCVGYNSEVSCAFTTEHCCIKDGLVDVRLLTYVPHLVIGSASFIISVRKETIAVLMNSGWSTFGPQYFQVIELFC